MTRRRYESQFGKPAREFWSNAGARQRQIGTRDYVARAICYRLDGMRAVKLGLLLVLIGGASV